MKCFRVIIAFCVALCSCSNDDDDPVFCEGSGLTLSLIEISQASECGVADGRIIVTASGGVGPHQYSIDSQIQSDGTFDRISSGVYTITVSDKNGCTADLVNVTVEAGNLSFTHDVVEDTDCSGGNGSVSINILQGEGPFLYRIDNGEFQEQSSFHNLRAGQYEVTLRAGECTSRFDLTIPKGNTGTSWNGDVLPLIKNNCALSGCHNGVTRPDLRVYATAKHYASQIKTLTADRSMPFTGSITRQEIDLLACWVDEGAVEN